MRKLYTKDETLNRVQDTIKESLDPVLSDLLLNRVSFDAVINTTNTVIPHNLGRIPSGFIVYDIINAATIHRVVWSDTTITLKASSTATIKFFLF